MKTSTLILLALLLLPSCSQKPADIKLNELNSVCEYMDALVSLSDEYIALVGDRLWADVSAEEQARLDELENKLEDIGQACEKKYTRAGMKECPSYQKAIDNHARMNEVGYGPNEEEEYIKRQQEESKGAAAAQQVTDTRLAPQPIDYDGKPELEYRVNDAIVALDGYVDTDADGRYIRMRFEGREMLLKMTQRSRSQRTYEADGLVVTFGGIVYGECTGEGAQAVKGTLHVQRGSASFSTPFSGSDTEFPSRECQEVGNGG